LDVAFVLGIDGGGSRTTAALASGSDVVAIATNGPANVRTFGPEAAIAVIDSVIGQVLAKSNLERTAVAAVVAGLAGISSQKERAPVEAWLARSFAGRPTRVVADVELVLAAGSRTGDGVAVISGTGSIVFGRTAAGKTARSGGWGPTVGDPGSGYAIGRAALLATAEALDGIQPHGRLSQLIVTRTGAASAEELGIGQGPREIASLVPLVAEAAADEDPVAVEILEIAGKELASQVAAVLRELGWTGGIQPVLAGGVLVHVAAVRDALLRRVEAAGWTLRPASLVEQPALGAVALADALLGLAPAAL
jgi:Predicted N-acetylglucosamine kinase